MTELTITPKTADKTARFKGAIAAGEHVAVTIKGGAAWLGEDDGANLTLRVIDITTHRTLAVFPRPPETEDESASESNESVSESSASADTTDTDNAWAPASEDASDLYCLLNLNTTRAVAAARHMLRVPVLFVLGDTDDPRTLYFRDQYVLEYWPERIGDDTPYDLDNWPKQIDEWTELVEGWTERLNGLILSAERFTDKEVGGVSRNGVTIMLNDGDDDTDTVVDLYDGEVSFDDLDEALEDKQDVLTFDDAPTASSSNPVKSGGVKTAIDAVATNLSTHTGNNDIHVTAAQKAKWAEKVANATAGNFAGLDQYGNLTDSGKKALDFATAADKANLQSAISEEASARASAVSSESSARQSADSALSSRLSTLEGEDTSKSAREIAAEEVAKIVANADSDLDTLKEIADFLSDDQTAGTVAKRLSDLESGKVDVVSGKGLSTNDYTTTEKTKLAGIAAGAEVNVQSDWNQTNSSADDYIKNKPDVASCLTRAEAVDGFTKWEVDTIAPAYGLISCEWNESSTPGNTGWVLTMLYQDTQVSLLLQGDHDATSLTYPDIITLSRTRIHPAIDSALSPTSENPVQNKAVKAAVDGKRGVLDLAVYAEQYAWTFSDGVDHGVLIQDSIAAGWGAYPDRPWVVTGADFNTLPPSEYFFATKAEAEAVTEFFYYLMDGGDAIEITATRSTYVGPTQDALARTSQLAGKADKSEMSVTSGTGTATIQLKSGTSATVLTAHQSLAGLMPKYPFVAAAVESGALTLQDAKVQTWTPSAGASVTVGAAAYVTDAPARDMVLVIDCSSLTEGQEPTVTWGTHFHPRTDAGTDFACSAGAKNVYYISEYATGEFAVGGWTETAGGSGT